MKANLQEDLLILVTETSELRALNAGVELKRQLLSCSALPCTPGNMHAFLCRAGLTPLLVATAQALGTQPPAKGKIAPGGIPAALGPSSEPERFP